MSETNLDPQAASSQVIAEAKGKQLFAQEQYEEAVKHFLAAQGAYAQAGNKIKVAEMLNNAGVVYRRLGKHQEAAGVLEQACQTFVELGDQRREAQALGNLGGLYSKMKRYDEAEARFQRALDIFEKLDERVQHSQTLQAMAIMRFKRGPRSQALNLYEEALYFLPNPTFLQRLLRLLLRVRGWLMRMSPF
jgi:tetratricopeptide (TPR) repeat protein